MSLKTLKKMGVEGVMIDVWWGIVEREGPGTYDWTAYTQVNATPATHNLPPATFLP